MKKLIFIFTFVSISFGEVELKGNTLDLSAYLKDVPKTLVLQGSAQAKLQADVATVNLKVTTENKSLEVSLKLNANLRATILKKLDGFGIASSDISISTFSSTPRYGVFGGKAKSYKVSNSINVNIKSEKQFQSIAQIVDSISEVSYHGIAFEPSRRNLLSDSLRLEAFNDALRKAKQIESKFNVSLLPINFNTMIAPIENKNEEYKPNKFQYEELNEDPMLSKSSIGIYEPVGKFNDLLLKEDVTIEFQVIQKSNK